MRYYRVSRHATQRNGEELPRESDQLHACITPDSSASAYREVMMLMVWQSRVAGCISMTPDAVAAAQTAILDVKSGLTQSAQAPDTGKGRQNEKPQNCVSSDVSLDQCSCRRWSWHALDRRALETGSSCKPCPLLLLLKIYRVTSTVSLHRVCIMSRWSPECEWECSGESAAEAAADHQIAKTDSSNE